MTHRTRPTDTTDQPPTPALHPDLAEWLRGFERFLGATNKSPRTIEAYRYAVTKLAVHGVHKPVPDIGRADLEHVMTALLANASASTASLVYRGWSQFFKFVQSEDGIRTSPMDKMSMPIVPPVPIPVLTSSDIAALLATCTTRTFHHLRDAAIIRVLADTGMRKSELLGMRVADIDDSWDVIHVVGKGRRPRACPFGKKTGLALDRYRRARANHDDAEREMFWLKRGGGALDGSGLATTLRRRGRVSGIGPVHPHQFRHTFSHRYLAAGGNETDLMRLNGWTSREMLERYGASAADERARAAHQTMRLGDDY
jgi:integrase/recombinase XerC